jgi:uncharacterized surface protein with fasciclin (FAS1) repeats
MAPTAAVIGLAVTAPLTFLSGCGSGDDVATQNIAQIAEKAPELSTLVAALTATDLVSAVSAKDPKKTVFAPTNDAFSLLGNETLNCLLEPVGLPTLSDVLKYHVVPEEAKAADLTNKESLPTLDGKNNLTVSLAGGNVTIEGTNKAEVVKADIMATNGVVHEINAVLIPEGFTAPKCGTGTITATAAGNTDLETLVTALGAANLTETFDGTVVYTVFAPTNEAFAKLGNDTVNCLLKAENVKALTQVLEYHVVAGYDLAAAIKDGLELETLEKENITFSTAGGGVTIDTTSGGNASVVTPDVYATNGVVHVIDAVLLPKDFTDNNPCTNSTIFDMDSSTIVV